MTTFYYEPPSVHQDKGFKGDVSAAYAWGTQVVEIEVDTDTGFIKLLKVTGAHDVGRVLNRLGIEGQIEGGVVMGQGYAFTEDLMIEDGVMKNPNFRDYKLVTAPEIPKWTSPSSSRWTAKARRAPRASAKRHRSAWPPRPPTPSPMPPARACSSCPSPRRRSIARCTARRPVLETVLETMERPNSVRR
jgi:xanthine dehydrogenase molybdopterin-binding subunit B